MKPLITVYGFGYVGKALWRFLKDHYPLQIFDPRPTLDRHDPEQKRLPLKRERRRLAPTEYAVICVPTPSARDGSCDVSRVAETVKKTRHSYYLIKSTVPPGTTKELARQTGKKIVFSPEYIGEGKYEVPFWKDYPHPTNMKLHQFHIFGGERKATGEWVRLWQKVAGWGSTYHQTDSTTAELVKYIENSFLAAKKIFCDEFYNLAEVFGVDYNELKELWLLDARVGRSMTLIYPESRGFSGKCLPKDLRAIIRAAERAGYSPTLLKEVLALNKRLRRE